LSPVGRGAGPKRGHHRVGFDRFSGLSKIHFADCADAMIGLLEDDNWLHRAPIVQY
jgi:putative NADH-flavin reductase